MILNTITLHNFMSYGDAIVDMTSFSIACLSGFNGAGKSAILDAVTWALWECARSTSDELIRAGESEMWVDLIFQLEGALYRVRRSRQRAAARSGTRAGSKGTLEFQISRLAQSNGNGRGHPAAHGHVGEHENGDGTHWLSLTCPTMKETQARICEVLRMDYDTFINSVYLRQGRADEFTTRPPAERKQVLSEILGLSYFDRLQELAKEQARTRKGQIELLEAGLADRETVAANLSDARRQKAEIDKFYMEVASACDKQAAELEAIGLELSELAALATQLEPTRQRLAELEQDASALESSLAKLSKRLEECDAILNSSDDAEALSARFNQLKSQVEQLDEISLSRQEIETRRLELKSTIANTRGRIEVELEHQQAEAARLRESKEKLVAQLANKDKLSAQHARYQELLKQEAVLAQKQEAHAELTTRAEQLHTQIVETRFHLEAQLEQKEQMAADLQQLLQAAQEMDAEEKLLQEELEELERCEAEFEAVEEQGLRIRHEIDAANAEVARLREQQEENDAKCQELHDAKSLTMCPLCAAPIVDRAAVLARYKVLHEQKNLEIDELETRKRKLENQRQELRQRYLELRRKLDGRKRLDMRIGEFNARKAAMQRANENLQRVSDEVTELSKRLKTQQYCELERESLINIKAQLHKLEFDPIVYSGLQTQIRALRHLDFRYQQSKRDEAELARIEIDLPALEHKISELKHSLESDNYAPAERAEIIELERQLDKIPYDRVHHQQCKSELAKLLPMIDRLKEIDRAQAEKPGLVEEIASTSERLRSRSEMMRQLESSIRVWSARLERRDDLESRRLQLEGAYTAARENVQDLKRQQIIISARIEQLEGELAAFETRRQQLNNLITEMNDYSFLAEAFGKKGIQAVIIENAVPEIEAEANKLLARLTDNQMHVAFVTQQKTKQGNIIETLDIVIADQLGTRNYELYSGGEAFKINFAIRLALSRLLARRAGAKLQSLIIDEGFGSQDEESRARLVRAINAIRPDFARILVVTHIAEVKELFPVQLQVEKQNGVSSVNLVRAY